MSAHTRLAVTHTLRRLSFRISRGNTAKLCLLVLAGAFLSGCPVADPYTASRIKNDTAETIVVEVTLDDLDGTGDWAEEELRSYAARGEGVELTALDAPRYAGTYRLAPAAVLVVHEGMGYGPYHRLSALTVTRRAATETYSGADEINGLFQQAEGYEWEFRLSGAR